MSSIGIKSPSSCSVSSVWGLIAIHIGSLTEGDIAITSASTSCGTTFWITSLNLAIVSFTMSLTLPILIFVSMSSIAWSSKWMCFAASIRFATPWVLVTVVPLSSLSPSMINTSSGLTSVVVFLVTFGIFIVLDAGLRGGGQWCCTSQTKLRMMFLAPNSCFYSHSSLLSILWLAQLFSPSQS